MVNSCLLVVAAALSVSTGQVLAHETPCNVGNDTKCLLGVRDYLTTPTWWFGDAYSTACPESTRSKNPACLNPDPTQKTVISRLLQRTNFDVSKITQFLRMRFYTSAGSYVTCGHKITVPNVFMDADVDSTHVSYLDMWVLARRPAITWEPEPGAMYTLVAYDVGQMNLAGLWVNIGGGDSALGQELVPYRGPLNAFDRVNLHVFALFKQTGPIDEAQFDLITQNIDDYVAENGLYRLENLLAAINQIQDPMAVGFIPTKADPYGVARVKAMNTVNNCPWLVYRMKPNLQKIVNVYNITGGKEANSLDVEVEVTYTSDAISFTACCQSVTQRARTIQLDPLSTDPVSPVFVRAAPYVRLSAVNMLDANAFEDKLYTLVLLDVTNAILTPSSRVTSLLWFVMDIPGQYAADGMQHVSYASPVPALERSADSLYAFLVFRQERSLMIGFNLAIYCTGSSPCNLNVYQLVQDHNLTLSGVNWFTSRPDAYSRMKLYESNISNRDKACTGVSGYGSPCPDQCAPTTTTVTTTKSSVRNGARGAAPGTVLFIVVSLLSAAILK
ncbi:unnamed protein product [Lymnaea stagnalis]|uniref:Uncharacterized protein n=1 Tax=Lymnaea stagnalis TaxID=6523 RepID=A0AAV2IJL4_LYMST